MRSPHQGREEWPNVGVSHTAHKNCSSSLKFPNGVSFKNQSFFFFFNLLPSPDTLRKTSESTWTIGETEHRGSLICGTGNMLWVMFIPNEVEYGDCWNTTPEANVRLCMEV
jgi:hypothetical protein